jgi:hypothetical protein
VIYPSIGNFILSKKRHTSGGQKGENKPLKPKNGIMEQKNIDFWGSSENNPSEQCVIPGITRLLLEPKFRFWVLMAFFTPKVFIFLIYTKYLIDFEGGRKGKKKPSEPENGIRDQIPVFGSDDFFLLHIKFPIDHTTKFRFWALMAFFTFWTNHTSNPPPPTKYLFSSYMLNF